MKKYGFLVPIAVAVSSLVRSTDVSANDTAQSKASLMPADPGSQKIRVPTASGQVDAFVLSRSSDGALLAQHDSHSSHESHSSHASHESHSSHSSHSSHYSGGASFS